MPLAPNYQPKAFEESIYERWMSQSVGLPEAQAEHQKLDSEAQTHSVLMPPPNLTGVLHTGHTFQHFLMDTLSRINRQKKNLNLWYPGVDHAGLQLEGVVDKLIKKGEFDDQLEENERDPIWLKKNNPEKWLTLAWQKVNMWRDNQKNQAGLIGDTPDWSRQLFTLDERAVEMVSYAFIRYWQDGLLYKGSYLINWSVGLQTALSDVAGEIDYETRVDPFVTFEYQLVVTNRHLFELNTKLLRSTLVNTGYEDEELYLKLMDFFIAYPVTVSTVRPETIFGDVAIIIHPEVFEQKLIMFGFSFSEAKKVIELMSLKYHNDYLFYFNVVIDKTNPAQIKQPVRLFISESDDVDPKFGTGALKITPGSDPVDYELFKKYLGGGEIPQAINRDGRLSEICGKYAGLTREEARPVIIRDLLEAGAVPFKPNRAEIERDFEPEKYDWDEGAWNQGSPEKKLEMLSRKYPHYAVDWEYEHNVTICERTKTVIEPLISEEFFLNYQAKTATGKSLKEHGQEGVRQTKFFSDDYQERGLNFLENIKDWCISRDLVWGHTMPIWYDLNVNPGKRFGGPNENIPGLKIQVNRPDEPGNWVQEEKILDTWFSSCLWPLSTLDFIQSKQFTGKDSDFDRFYPTQELVTARDIFYTWIVRMIMLGHYFTGQTPFQYLIVTPTILDEKGRKMSKSLGNGLDPVEAVNKFSADSLRLALLGGMIPNRNMRMGGALADKLCEKYRNFGNKLWNVARFLESKEG